MKALLLAASVLGLATAWAAAPQPAQAQDKKVFALVPKLVGVPFYSDVEAGCKAEAEKIGVECLFTGGTQVDEAEQVRVHPRFDHQERLGSGDRARTTRRRSRPPSRRPRPRAFRSSPSIRTRPSPSAPASSAPTTSRAARRAARPSRRHCPAAASTPSSPAVWRPTTSTSASTGFKSQLGGKFTEVAGSPYPCDDDANKAVQLVQDVLAKNPDLSGFFFSGGWPMFAPQAYARARQEQARGHQGRQVRGRRVRRPGLAAAAPQDRGTRRR